jgi:hypothetical protein
MAFIRALWELGLIERLNRLGFWTWVAIIVITAVAAGWFGASWLWWLVILEVAGFLTIWLGPRLKPVVDLFVPMWMPVLVLVVAAYALFLTDQGRDLGIGLLDAKWWKLALLAAALFYWALGTWHAARLGLTRAFGATRDEWKAGFEEADYSAKWRTWLPRLLRWLPRFLGVCAHLYATITIALAAQHVVRGPWWFGLIYFTPSLLIAIGTCILWWHDSRYMAARDARDALQPSGDEDPKTEEKRKKAEDNAKLAHRRMIHAVWTLFGLGTVVVVTLVAAWWREFLEPGFVGATSWVLFSAALFLLLVGHRASIGEFLLRPIPEHRKKWVKDKFHETQEQPATSSWVLSAILVVIAVALIGFAWFKPLSLGNALGSMVAGFTAFGVYIVIVNGVRIMAGSSWRFAGIGAFVLLLAIGTSLVRNFHVARLCGYPETECTSSEGSIEARATVGEAAVAWYEQARQGVSADEPVPMLIVATAGGGIRAAYWTATILERLEQKLTPEMLRRHLFAISGVSGGSVGAAAYAAAVKAARDQPAAPTAFLHEDFLAPAITTLAFVDLPSTILPDIGTIVDLADFGISRATALERAFEDASGGLLAHPFLEFFPSADDLSAKPWRPALLLNSTHQNTGRRVITSHLKVERRVFLDAFDAHDLLGADMPASTAAHNSARFTYVSPAGRLLPQDDDGDYGQPQGFLLDGGYFENYGAVTALQVLREALAAINEHRAKEKAKAKEEQEEQKELPEVRAVVLQISSDPSLRARDRARINGGTGGICDPAAGYLKFEHSEAEGLFGWEERDSGGRFAPLNELVAPLAGVIASRSAHGVLASEELARAICVDRQLEIGPEDSKHQEDGPVADVPMPRDVTSAIENPLVAIKGVPENVTEAAASASISPPASPPQAPPVYAHLAMCESEEAKLPPDASGEVGQAIEPPLGWVLSPRLRPGFAALLGAACGNNAELKSLVEALRIGSPDSMQ